VKARISYLARGAQTGRPLVLLPSIGGGAGLWGRFGERLASERRTLELDPPGFGGSSPPALRLSTRAVALELLGALEQLGVEDFDVFGISLGGLLAVWLAILASGRAKGVVLASCAARGLDFAPRSLSKAARLTLDFVGSARPKPALAQDLAARPASVGAARAKRHAGRDAWSRARLLHFLSAALLHDPGDQLLEITAPTLLLHGGQDAILSAGAETRLLARLPNAILQELPNVGHDLIDEAPELAAELTLQFLRERSSA
jgi:pimeloyl-ACP methyl ester carboxylesterase